MNNSLDDHPEVVKEEVKVNDPMSLDGDSDRQIEINYSYKVGTPEEENQKYIVTLEDLHHSTFLTTAVEDKTATELPIVGADYLTPYAMKMVIRYLNHHKTKPIESPEKPMKDKDLKKLWKDPWDPDFAEEILKDGDTTVICSKLMEVIQAANYLGITPLLNLMATKIASVIKGAKMEDIDTITGGRLRGEEEVKDDDEDDDPEAEVKAEVKTENMATETPKDA
jgi:hypothetical protein